MHIKQIKHNSSRYIQHRHKAQRYKLCVFFIVPGGSPALLWMPNFEILGILSVKGSTIESRQHMQEINEQSEEDTYCINKKSNSK